jgi:hypothetical protein
MIAVQVLERRTAELKEKEVQIEALAAQVEELKSTVAARLDALELRQKQPVQLTAEQRN